MDLHTARCDHAVWGCCAVYLGSLARDLTEVVQEGGASHGGTGGECTQRKDCKRTMFWRSLSVLEHCIAVLEEIHALAVHGVAASSLLAAGAGVSLCLQYGT